VVSELVPAGSDRPPDDVHQRRSIRFERHEFPYNGFRKLQVSLLGRVKRMEIDYRDECDASFAIDWTQSAPDKPIYPVLPVRADAEEGARKKSRSSEFMRCRLI
jgi:hypothetical protein